MAFIESCSWIFLLLQLPCYVVMLSAQGKKMFNLKIINYVKNWAIGSRCGHLASLLCVYLFDFQICFSTVFSRLQSYFNPYLQLQDSRVYHHLRPLSISLKKKQSIFKDFRFVKSPFCSFKSLPLKSLNPFKMRLSLSGLPIMSSRISDQVKCLVWFTVITHS